MKVAITGSSGFVGTFLKEELRSHNIELIEIDIVNGYDISDKSIIDKLPSFDCLVHLAAKSFVPDSYINSHDFYHINLLGTINALELCKKHKAKMVFMSSYVYGEPQYLPIDENHPLKAFNPYADTKIKGEELCQSYHRFFDIPVSIIRPFNIYGPGQNENFLIPLIVDQIKTNKSIELKDGTPMRDFVYVSDVAKAISLAIKIENGGYNIYNIGSGISKSVSEICNIISETFDFEIPISFNGEKRQAEVNNTVANIEKAKLELGWEPAVGFIDGIKKLKS